MRRGELGERVGEQDVGLACVVYCASFIGRLVVWYFVMQQDCSVVDACVVKVST